MHNFKRKIQIPRLKKKAFSLVEVILATTIILIIILGVSRSLSYSVQSTSTSNNASIANYLAYEGMEAIRNLRDENFSNLTDGTYGITLINGRWALVASQDVSNIFTRRITISTLTPTSKRATVIISWLDKQISLSQDFTTWRNISFTATRGGMLVYGDGGTTTDAIRYRILSGTTNTWGSVLSTADIDGTSTNRALVNLKVYSSKTRNEKIIVSKHCGGSTTYIYSQVWNGTAWGNVQLLSTYSGCSNNQTEDYDGVYLNNGTFVAVVSDNTSTPKYRYWDGVTWSLSFSARTVSNIPRWIYLSARPGTNEMMLVTYDSANDTKTQYYNGASLILLASWSAVTTHSTAGSTLNHSYVDFEWSSSAITKGLLIYPESNNDTSLSAKIFTANGIGGGTWASVVNSSALAARWENLTITNRPGSTEFMVCEKDRKNPPLEFGCFRTNTTPTWTIPTNNIVGSGLDISGYQLGYRFEYERTGVEAIAIYADETLNPKLKTYNSSSNTFVTTSTSLASLNGIAKTVQLKRATDNDDIMVLIGDVNNDFYTQVWDGTANSIFTTPSGKAFAAQGTNGYDWDGFYFDFAWDES
jgi:Tfp pilus assembly protein PilV